MAGYLITLSDEQSLENCIRTGTYSTILNSPRFDSWGGNHEGTFADYLSMNENDLVFFFIKRKIYGCGKLKSINGDCKFLNYQNADQPAGDTEDNYREHLLQYGSSKNRCFCLFEPAPCFFKEGVDMDEVLQSTSCPFHSVRTLWKLSFIKMDDEESDALFGIILKHNEERLHDVASHFEYDRRCHDLLREKILDSKRLTYSSIVNSCRTETGYLKHEMAIEATLCEKLTHENVAPFGKWDYISHQVAASPFKPIDYMDKMDVFGYRYIPGYKVKSRYLIAELKKDQANIDVVEQIMKYVDWVSDEYVNGDYSMIEAYIVALDFSDEIKCAVKEYCIRKFNRGFRPTQFCTWTNIKLVKYRAVENDIVFEVVDID